MEKILKTIVFFGTEDFSLVALKGLHEAGFKISAVITKPDTKRGRKQLLTAPAVKIYAIQHGIKVIQPSKLKDSIDDIKQLGENIGVLVSYGKIVPDEIIDLFNPGIVNLHPSLLPRYRGPSPIESAILNGDAITGVSIMKLASAMDAGPVYKQVEYKLRGDETKPELYDKLARIGTEELIKILPDIDNGSLFPVEQNENEAVYCQLLNKDSGRIEPDKLTAVEAERMVRAYIGFPKARVFVDDVEIIITKSHVTENNDSPLTIKCKDSSYLAIDELIPPSGRLMTSNAFMNGVQKT